MESTHNGWTGGSTRTWRIVRAAVLERDRAASRRTGEPWCRVRVPGVCVQEADPMHVHHTKGRAVTGDDPRYLVTACPPCNLHIGDPQRKADPPCNPITHWT